MSLYKTFDTDKHAETDGIILDYGDVRFRIARAGGSNKRFKEDFKHRIKPYRRQIDQGLMDEDVGTRLMAESYAATVILSWGTKVEDNGNVYYSKTIKDKDGNDLEFTVENVTKVLLDLPDLFDDIKDAAGQVSNFRAQEDEADIKN